MLPLCAGPAANSLLVDHQMLQVAEPEPDTIDFRNPEQEQAALHRRGGQTPECAQPGPAEGVRGRAQAVEGGPAAREDIREHRP